MGFNLIGMKKINWLEVARVVVAIIAGLLGGGAAETML